jgi:hypothetical protein
MLILNATTALMVLLRIDATALARAHDAGVAALLPPLEALAAPGAANGLSSYSRSSVAEDVGEMRRVLAHARCASCGVTAAARTKIRICSRCCAAGYCSEACQRAHWSQHKVACRRDAAAAAAAAE